MPLVVSREPTIYIAERALIFSYRGDGSTSRIVLSDWINTITDSRLREIVGMMLSRLFRKFTKLGISFQPISLELEQDAEIDRWVYAVVKIGLEVREEIFGRLSEILIADSYSELSPNDAVKVLLIFEHV